MSSEKLLAEVGVTVLLSLKAMIPELEKAFTAMRLLDATAK